MQSGTLSNPSSNSHAWLTLTNQFAESQINAKEFVELPLISSYNNAFLETITEEGSEFEPSEDGSSSYDHSDHQHLNSDVASHIYDQLRRQSMIGDLDCVDSEDCISIPISPTNSPILQKIREKMHLAPKSQSARRWHPQHNCSETGSKSIVVDSTLKGPCKPEECQTAVSKITNLLQTSSSPSVNQIDQPISCQVGNGVSNLITESTTKPMFRDSEHKSTSQTSCCSLERGIPLQTNEQTQTMLWKDEDQDEDLLVLKTKGNNSELVWSLESNKIQTVKDSQVESNKKAEISGAQSADYLTSVLSAYAQSDQNARNHQGGIGFQPICSEEKYGVQAGKHYLGSLKTSSSSVPMTQEIRQETTNKNTQGNMLPTMWDSNERNLGQTPQQHNDQSALLKEQQRAEQSSLHTSLLCTATATNRMPPPKPCLDGKPLVLAPPTHPGPVNPKSAVVQMNNKLPNVNQVETNVSRDCTGSSNNVSICLSTTAGNSCSVYANVLNPTLSGDYSVANMRTDINTTCVGNGVNGVNGALGYCFPAPNATDYHNHYAAQSCSGDYQEVGDFLREGPESLVQQSAFRSDHILDSIMNSGNYMYPEFFQSSVQQSSVNNFYEPVENFNQNNVYLTSTPASSISSKLHFTGYTEFSTFSKFPPCENSTRVIEAQHPKLLKSMNGNTTGTVNGYNKQDIDQSKPKQTRGEGEQQMGNPNFSPKEKGFKKKSVSSFESSKDVVTSSPMWIANSTPLSHSCSQRTSSSAQKPNSSDRKITLCKKIEACIWKGQLPAQEIPKVLGSASHMVKPGSSQTNSEPLRPIHRSPAVVGVSELLSKTDEELQGLMQKSEGPNQQNNSERASVARRTEEYQKSSGESSGQQNSSASGLLDHSPLRRRFRAERYNEPDLGAPESDSDNVDRRSFYDYGCDDEDEESDNNIYREPLDEIHGSRDGVLKDKTELFNIPYEQATSILQQLYQFESCNPVLSWSDSCEKPLYSESTRFAAEDHTEFWDLPFIDSDSVVGEPPPAKLGWDRSSIEKAKTADLDEVTLSSVHVQRRSSRGSISELNYSGCRVEPQSKQLISPQDHSNKGKRAKIRSRREFHSCDSSTDVKRGSRFRKFTTPWIRRLCSCVRVP
ncbi:unnamed protein product [Calicophoron daubneyi]|uniref:Uncharacterized protein n=1 Tax=Calicophoron daubneyi TaxID=300641 RepID=A0AAV2SYV2_CALDB